MTTTAVPWRTSVLERYEHKKRKKVSHRCRDREATREDYPQVGVWHVAACDDSIRHVPASCVEAPTSWDRCLECEG